MRILMICEGISRFSIVAQPWKHVYEVAKRMLQYGHDVEILTDSTKENTTEIDGVPICRVKKKVFFQSDQLSKYLNNNRFEIINWHGSDTWSAVQIWQLRNKLRKDIVLTLHSGPLTLSDFMNLKFSDLFSVFELWNSILNSACPSWLIKKWMNSPQIRGVITLSQRLKTYLVNNKIKREGEVQVIRSGVDIKKYNPSLGLKITDENNLPKIDKNDKVILYFGPLSPLRGVDILLMAMRYIKEQIPSVKLLLLARDRAVKVIKLEKLVNRMENIFLVKGILKEETLIYYLNLADVVVLPFKFWPQVECPLTILEAMAMGKPVVTTYVGAIPEIIDNYKNGIMVHPGSVKELVQTVINLLTNKDLSHNIGKKARFYVESFHDWDVIIRQTLKIFQMLT